MTIAEIIKNLLDQAADRESSIDPEDPEDIFRQDARALREAARVLSGMEPPNDPLTLEELREMDGEPVWICHPDRSDGVWALVDLEYELCRTAKGGIAIFDTYGKTWLAYRRRPEGGSGHG